MSVAEPEDPSALDAAQAASIREWVGLARRVKRVEVEGRVKGAAWVSPGEKPFAAEAGGYTIHAGVRLEGGDRGKLEKVCRYVLRPAFAEERLRERPDGRIEYGLRKARWDGGTKVVLEPLELLEKLAALVPPPRSHLVRYHGVLGPSHEWREAVVPREAEGEKCRVEREDEPWGGEDEEESWGAARRRRKKRRGAEQGWATRLRRSLGLDALRCPGCGGRMKVIATIVEPGMVRRILRSMGLSGEIPSRAPPCGLPDEDF